MPTDLEEVKKEPVSPKKELTLDILLNLESNEYYIKNKDQAVGIPIDEILEDRKKVLYHLLTQKK